MRTSLPHTRALAWLGRFPGRELFFWIHSRQRHPICPCDRNIELRRFWYVALGTPVDSFVPFFIGFFFFGHCLPGPDRLTRVNTRYELTSQRFHTHPFPMVLSCLLFGFSQLPAFVDFFLSTDFSFGLTDPFVLLRPPIQPIQSPLFIEGGDLRFP